MKANGLQLDDTTIQISSASLRSALNLTAADRRWMDFLLQTITSTWDPANPTRPRLHGYLGSEEFIRLQFEEYLMALLAATKYHHYLYAIPHHKRDLSAFPDIEGDPTVDFGEAWLDSWKITGNYRLWHRFTDSHLFDIVDPRHPTAGGLSIEDINRRLTQQIQDLHLDERLATSRETIGKHLASGQKKVSTAFNNLWGDIEAMRAAQRAKAQESRDAVEGPVASPRTSSALPSPSNFDVTSPEKTPTSATHLFDTTALRARTPDLSNAQAAVGAAGQRAGAYFSSWGTWASEKKKGWGAKKLDTDTTSGNTGSTVASPTTPVSRGPAIPNPAGHGAEKDKENMPIKIKEKTSATPASPRSPRSPRKSIRRGESREEVGSDGIGRLDA